jgi:Flp pilus assembly protein TadG
MKEHMMNKQQGIRAKLKSRQQGAVAIIVAICLVVLVGMLGLVLDLGRLYVAKTDLQNAADAAALSGAKQLDGTAERICCDSDSAVGMAIETASLNSFYSNTGKNPVTITDDDIEFSNSKDGPWEVATAVDDATDKYFIRVNTASGNLSTWFIHVIPGVAKTTSTMALAVAGRYPPGALTPMFVPVVRRNSDQSDPSDTYPNCRGYIYDNSNNGSFGDNKKVCPNPSKTPPDTDPTDYRKVDFSGNWGFLKANQCRHYTTTTSNEVACTSPLSPDYEKGSYYIITPTNNIDTSASQWVSAAAWTGNFGFMVKDSTDPTQKALWEAMCTGSSVTQYSVPGCGLVHTGGMSGPRINLNLNTRFDETNKQVELPPEFCPSDTNVYYPSSWPSGGEGYYSGYLAGANLKAPANSPPGKAGRRLMRVYVVDNAWLAGYDMLGTNDDSCHAQKITGSSYPAHIVGCAEFFMWKPADNTGKLFAEYVRKLDNNECNASGSNTAIRLYH